MNIFSGDVCGPNDLLNVLGMRGNVFPMYRLTDRLQIVAENEHFTYEHSQNTAHCKKSGVFQK